MHYSHCSFGLIFRPNTVKEAEFDISALSIYIIAGQSDEKIFNHKVFNRTRIIHFFHQSSTDYYHKITMRSCLQLI